MFEFDGYREIVGEPQRQGGQRLAERKRTCPGLEQPDVPVSHATTRNRVERRIGVGQEVIALPQEVHEFIIQIGSASRNNINDGNGYSFLQ